MRRVLTLLRRAAVSWWNGEPFRVAAALAFYTIYSLSPLLVTAVAAAGLVFDRGSARARVAEVGELVGPQGGDAVAEVARQAELAGGGPLALAVGLVTLLAGSTVVFLVWVYYSALICVYGAEITRAITLDRDARVRPDDHAVPRGETGLDPPTGGGANE